MVRPEHERRPTAAAAAAVDVARARIQAALDARLAAVEDEIRLYPKPIPACDAQFNHLLEQRADIPRHLARLRALEGAPEPTARAALEALVRSCPYLEGLDTGIHDDDAGPR